MRFSFKRAFFCFLILALLVLCTMPAWANMLFVGRVKVITAGTPQPLCSSCGVSQAYLVVIQARAANAGTVYIGGLGMVKGTGAGVGAELAPGQSFTIPGGFTGVDPSKIFVDADNANDAVNVSLAY